MSVGIYLITNKKTQCFYVGASINIESRFDNHRHRAFTPSNKEFFSPLYMDMRRYGVFNFEFSILELCEEENLEDREKFWIKHLKAQELGYNKANGGLGVKGLIEGDKHFNHILEESDVINIRTHYKNHDIKKWDLYEEYKDKISKSGFSKVWHGDTWGHIMPEIFTDENRKLNSMNGVLKKRRNDPNVKPPWKTRSYRKPKPQKDKNDRVSRLGITTEDVRKIRTMRKDGLSRHEAYKYYSERLTFSSFQNIWYYGNWKDITV